MSRLTEKYNDGYYFNADDNKDIAEKDIENDFFAAKAMRDKLGQLEDTEDKLGVWLNVFVEALTGSYYVKIKFPSGIVRRQRFWGKHTFIDNIDGEWVFVYQEPYYVKLKDYGKTWSLTKEELE